MLVTLDGNTAAAVIKAFKRRLKGAPRPAKADRPARGGQAKWQSHICLSAGPKDRARSATSIRRRKAYRP